MLDDSEIPQSATPSKYSVARRLESDYDSDYKPTKSEAMSVDHSPAKAKRMISSKSPVMSSATSFAKLN